MINEAPYHTSGVVRLTRTQLIGTMVGLVLTMLLSALDQTIIGTAEPRIIATLSGFNRYPWVATAYLLMSTLSIPILGKLSDIYGRKPLFMVAAILFVGSSALCGAAGAVPIPLDGMNQLILFRGLQGIGAGGIMGLIFTILGDIFSPQERGQYQGFFSAVWGFASILGPTTGGWLTDHVSWRACFYVNVPIGIAAITALYFELPSIKTRSVRRHIDWAGFATLTAALIPLLLALTWATDYGWRSLRVESLLATSVVFGCAFIYTQGRALEPLMPLSLFRNSVVSLCSICVFVLGMGMFGIIIYLPLYMQGVMGVSATQSGNLIMPLLLGAVVGTAFVGQAMTRFGRYKHWAVLGAVFVAGGMTTFAFITPFTSRTVVILGMIVCGLGWGLLAPIYLVAVQNVAPVDHMGAATAVIVFSRSIGATVGVAVFGSVMLTHYHRDFAIVAAQLPDNLVGLFANPVLLMQMRPQLQATLGGTSGGLQLMQRSFEGVRSALGTGLHLMFVASAVLMVLSIVLHATLRDLRLKGHHATTLEEMPVL
jgi:EmrB/QacA subfamily drug resistance transporter